jgi:hypothetical protein
VQNDYGRRDKLGAYMSIRHHAERIAQEFGLAVDEFLGEAEGILRRA